MATDSGNLTPLDVCAEYEAEQALWTHSPVPQSGANSYVVVRAAGLGLFDTRRPRDQLTDDYRDQSVGTTHQTLVEDGGLEDIVALIIARCSEAQREQARKIADRVVNACVATGRQYTFGVFVDLATRLGQSTDPKFYRSVIPEREFLKAQCHAALPVLRERVLSTDWLTRLEFRHLVKLRRHDVIKSLISEGKLDLTTPDESGETPLHFIVENGLVDLLTCFSNSTARRSFDSKQYYRTCAAARYSHGSARGLMVVAAQRGLPNLRIITLLHEKLGIDVDEKANPFGEDGASGSGRAIHWCAQGNYFWHLSQGLPYLLQRGASTQVLDCQGDTPLHVALRTLEQDPDRNSLNAVELLLDAGADVKVLNSKDQSCLSKIISHQALLQTVLRRPGVTVTLDAVFAAIEAQNIQALSSLLQARPQVVHEQPDPQKKQHAWALSGDSSNWKSTALHFAASCSWLQRPDVETTSLEGSIRIVELLLDHGVDPLATFDYQPAKMPRSTFDDDFDADAEQDPPRIVGTVLHEIIADGGLFRPILQRGVNVESRDQQGRTLLLAACSSRLGPGADIDAVSWAESVTDDPKRTILETLVDLKADLTAVNHEGKNALHLMATSMRSRSPLNASIKLISNRCPDLMTQADIEGNTPLFACLAEKIPVMEIAEVLIECGSDVRTLGPKGNSILHALAGHINLANAEDAAMQLFRQVLLRHDLNINARNDAGETPLAIYVQNFDINTDSRFGGFFGSQAKFGRAAQAKEPPVVSALKAFTSLGADPFVTTTPQNHNLLHVLAKRPGVEWDETQWGDLEKHLRMAWRYLWKDVGVDPYMEDVAGRTAWDLVVASGAEVSKLDGEGSDEEEEERETGQDGAGDWDDDPDL